eukprot:scaffold111283_cov29-Tisochrysis_lutea.AAC.4
MKIEELAACVNARVDCRLQAIVPGPKRGMGASTQSEEEQMKGRVGGEWEAGRGRWGDVHHKSEGGFASSAEYTGKISRMAAMRRSRLAMSSRRAAIP